MYVRVRRMEGVAGLLLYQVTLAWCQINGNYPFVTVPDQQIQPPNGTTKVFTTSILLHTTTTFTDQKFLVAARQFYNGAFSGFRSVGNVVTTNQNATQRQLTYDVTYDYITLRNDAGNGSSVISERIGRIQAVKLGLEANDVNRSFTVDLQSFRFTGDSICDKVPCQQGAFTHCNEITFAVDVTCRSSCKVNFCRNNGWCHHYNGTVQPVCSCPTNTIEWYIGRHCETYIHIWIPIVVLVLVFLCLVVIIAIGIYCYNHVRIRTFKPKPQKQVPAQLKQQTTIIRNGNYPKQGDPLKEAHAAALKRFKSAQEEQKMNGEQRKEESLPEPAPPPPQTSPPPDSVVSSHRTDEADEQRSSSLSSTRGGTPHKASPHYDDITSSTSTDDDDDVTDGTDSHHYSSADLPGGFDWRAPIRASSNHNSTEERAPKYSVPNKTPKTQEPVKDYVSESMLI